MKLLLTGALLASVTGIAAYMFGPELLGKLFRRGDTTVWGDECKRPTLEQMTGRLPNE